MAKILVVEDDQAILEMLKFTLEDSHYQVLTASDGLEAVNKARAENPDLILLDVILPKIQGYQVCRLLKFDEKYRHIPIIMLTGKTEEKDRLTGLKTGADEYLTKPFELDELLKIVKQFLK